MLALAADTPFSQSCLRTERGGVTPEISTEVLRSDKRFPVGISSDRDIATRRPVGQRPPRNDEYGPQVPKLDVVT
jgi:hypothetical protein